jgi:hypothetical protein
VNDKMEVLENILLGCVEQKGARMDDRSRRCGSSGSEATASGGLREGGASKSR